MAQKSQKMKELEAYLMAQAEELTGLQVRFNRMSDYNTIYESGEAAKKAAVDALKGEMMKIRVIIEEHEKALEVATIEHLASASYSED